MISKMIIAKIGGKIIENHKNLEHTINQFKTLLFDKKIIDKLVLIPGGGSYANFIRILDKKLDIGDDLSHWMAIYAMNSNGEAISQEYKDIKSIKNLEELKESKDSFLVFLPFDFLYQTDELPHSWSVTSDSITIYIAAILNLNKCFLIKDIDGIFIKSQSEPIKEISTKEYEDFRNNNKIADLKAQSDNIKKSIPIDLYSLKIINDFKISCIILNGRSDTTRIVSYFDGNISKRDKIYTKVRRIH